MPDLRATFVPGGFDDYSMPEVVAPAPKRVTPQVPRNIQEDVHRMELEAGPRGPDLDRRDPSLPSLMSTNSDRPGTGPSSPGMNDAQWTRPSISPFPKSNKSKIPPDDERRGRDLHGKMSEVLHSGDFDAQLSWAQDSLGWVEIQINDALREQSITGSRTPRPPSQIESEIRIDAISIVEHLAQQQHPLALVIVGKWLEYGKFDVPLDKEEASNHYNLAAQAGYARAEYNLGALFERSNNMVYAKDCYLRGMALGDAACLYRMGIMYLSGLYGERKDFQRGLDCMRAAADLADADAPHGAYAYGMLIIRDFGEIMLPEELLAPNPAVAKDYIERAALLNLPKAQLKMGQAYELCQLGCEFTPKLSLHYYKLAAKQGIPEAALGVSRWLLFGYDNLFPKNEQEAYKYAEEAAFAKLPTGEFAIGYFYEVGIHVDKDLKTAKKWYQQAADHGDVNAREQLKHLAQGKVLGEQDHETKTLTRIKSRYGSQRGQRPERFKPKPDNMPTVSESANSFANDVSAVPLPAMRSPRQSPRLDDQSNLPSMLSNSMSQMRIRPQSTAPYPDDDYMGRPDPLQSIAPYPEDDIRPMGRFDQSPNAGDRPGAFGPRPFAAEDRSRNSSPSAGVQNQAANYVPPMARSSRMGIPPAGWDSQQAGNTRKLSPSRGQGFDQRSVSNPAYDQRGYGSEAGKYQPPNYRGKPASYAPGHFASGPDEYSNPAASLPNAEEIQGQAPSARPQPRVGQAHRIPQLRHDLVRAGSAPPMSQQAVISGRPEPPVPGSVQHTTTAPTKPSAGPATFEAMGIPQAERENECVVM